MMTYVPHAQSRSPYLRAENTQKLPLRGRYCAALKRCLLRLGMRRAPHISDHLARDIGLQPTDLELRRLTLPSQTTWHPRL